MTTSELSLEQQLELARRTYPGRKVSSSLYGSEHRVLVEMEGEFKPSLTGNQQYRAQASDVIVAAYGLLGFASFKRHKDISIASIFGDDGVTLNFCGNNLLHASALALLSKENNNGDN